MSKTKIICLFKRKKLTTHELEFSLTFQIIRTNFEGKIYTEGMG